MSTAQIEGSPPKKQKIMESSDPRTFSETLSPVKRTRFQQLVQRYHQQLTVGCLNDACQNQHCISYNKSVSTDPTQAAVLAVDLAQKTIKDGTMFDCDSVNTTDEDEFPDLVSTSSDSDVQNASHNSTHSSDNMPHLTSATSSESSLGNASPKEPEKEVVAPLTSQEALRLFETSMSQDQSTKVAPPSESVPISDNKDASSNQLTLEEVVEEDVVMAEPDSKSCENSTDVINASDSDSLPPLLDEQMTQVENTDHKEHVDESDVKSKTKEHLTNTDTVLAGVSQQLTCDDAKVMLTSRIQEVFSFPAALSCSFQVDSSSDPTHALDLSALQSFYMNADNDSSLQSTLLSSVSKLVDGLPAYWKQHSQEANLAIMLLLIPEMMNPDNRGVFGKILLAIADLPQPSRDSLVQFFVNRFDSANFGAVLISIQQFLSMRLALSTTPPHEDREVLAAAKVLQVLNTANSEKSFVEFSEFQNVALCEDLDLKTDFINWIDETNNSVSFCNFPFLLETYIKSMILHIESAIQQQQEIRSAIIRSIFQGPQIPFCILRVRREHVVQDTLVSLMMNDSEFKKQLRVEFVGEEGVDEGGLQKELFQLIVREIFDAKYGMFTYDPDERRYWFNHMSFDNMSEFELIGVIVGLALYNQILLDCHFPLVVYKKIMGKEIGFSDMKDSMPVMYRSLNTLKTLDSDDVENLGLTFCINYDKFGESITHNLKENGDDIDVTGENLDEYIDLYTKWLLVDSVQKQFDAFNAGFQRVCGGPALRLFIPEELDLLISGSEVLDFRDLEKTTRYQDGYTSESDIIKHFWKIIHSLSTEDQKQFLSFTTGCDRSPIQGLGSLKLVISRHGGDTDSLPISHTCFNHLLIPEYSSPEKLKERLLMAIQNSEGFGML